MSDQLIADSRGHDDECRSLNRIKEWLPPYVPPKLQGTTTYKMLIDTAALLPSPLAESFESTTYDLDRECLFSGDGRYVLIWVSPEDESLPINEGYARILRRSWPKRRNRRAKSSLRRRG